MAEQTKVLLGSIEFQQRQKHFRGLAAVVQGGTMLWLDVELH